MFFLDIEGAPKAIREFVSHSYFENALINVSTAVTLTREVQHSNLLYLPYQAFTTLSTTPRVYDRALRVFAGPLLLFKSGHTPALDWFRADLVHGHEISNMVAPYTVSSTHDLDGDETLTCSFNACRAFTVRVLKRAQ